MFVNVDDGSTLSQYRLYITFLQPHCADQARYVTVGRLVYWGGGGGGRGDGMVL